MLLVPMPWADRVWALPFLTVLAPSERSAARQRRHFKPLTAWARQLIRQLHRWAPERHLVVVGDRAYAALELPWRRAGGGDRDRVSAPGCAALRAATAT